MTVSRSLGFSEHLLHGFLPRMSRENGVKLESKSRGFLFCLVLFLLLVFVPITRNCFLLFVYFWLHWVLVAAGRLSLVSEQGLLIVVVSLVAEQGALGGWALMVWLSRF